MEDSGGETRRYPRRTIKPPDPGSASTSGASNTTVPQPGESLSAFRSRVCSNLCSVAKEEEKLCKMKIALKKKKMDTSKARGLDKRSSKADLAELESACRQQEKLVASLKASSGAFKEKYKNEERFKSMQRSGPTVKEEEADHVDETQMVEDSPAVPPPKVAAVAEPGAPEPALEDSFAEATHQECVTSLGIQEAPTGADLPEDSRQPEEPMPAKDDIHLSSQPAECAIGAVSGGIEDCGAPCPEKGEVAPDVSTILAPIRVPGCAELGGPGAMGDSPAGLGLAGRASIVSVSAALGAVTDVVAPVTAAVSGVESTGVNSIAGLSAVTAAVTAADDMTVPSPAPLVDYKKTVPPNAGAPAVRPALYFIQRGGTGSGANNAVGAAVQPPVSYAQVARRGGEAAGERMSVPSEVNAPASGFNRRNLVQLRWEGEGPVITRRAVVDLILGMGFTAADIFALISPVGSAEHDLSFVRPEGMDLFWERYELLKQDPAWKGLTPIQVSRQQLIKNITILVRNESIPPSDLTVWLRRYGDVLTPLKKILDDRDIWTGGWSVTLRLRRNGNQVTHLPSSAYIGRDRLTIFYPGQPKVCHKCGAKGHFSSSCSLLRCSLCQGLGHLAKDCNTIRCNLCNQLGHPYSQCPEAWHNLDREVVQEMLRLDREEHSHAAPSAVPPPTQLGVPEAPVPVPSAGGPKVNPQSAPKSATTNVRPSNIIAEAARGAGTASTKGVSVIVPPAVRSRRLGLGDPDPAPPSEQGGSSDPKTAWSGLSLEDQDYLAVRFATKKKRKKYNGVPEPGESSGVQLSNRFEALSEDSIEISSFDSEDSDMEEEAPVSSTKRLGSDSEAGGKAKRHSPE